MRKICVAVLLIILTLAPSLRPPDIASNHPQPTGSEASHQFAKGEALVVAMADPSDLVLIDEVSALLGRELGDSSRAALRDSGSS